jgi:hypothetical protein
LFLISLRSEKNKKAQRLTTLSFFIVRLGGWTTIEPFDRRFGQNRGILRK